MEFVEVIDLDNRIIKLPKNSPLYYTEDGKNYSRRIDFKESFGSFEKYFLEGYEPIDIEEFNREELEDDNFEGQIIAKMVLDDSRILNHYYSFIGLDSENYLKLVPVKIPKDNMYTVDPTKIISINWYYLKSKGDKSEYMTLKDVECDSS